MLIEHHRLLEVLDYSPESGLFTWRVFKGANAASGATAGNVAVNGYIRIFLDGRSYLAHRLAWFFVTGSWPSCQIDHANGQRSDNRLINLRLATFAENARNSRLRRNNTSGVKGVSWSKCTSKWFAYVKTDGKRQSLGYFSTIEAAAEAVQAERKARHGAFANHGAGFSAQWRRLRGCADV